MLTPPFNTLLILLPVSRKKDLCVRILQQLLEQSNVLDSDAILRVRNKFPKRPRVEKWETDGESRDCCVKRRKRNLYVIKLKWHSRNGESRFS
jgi:hypothetical protein